MTRIVLLVTIGVFPAAAPGAQDSASRPGLVLEARDARSRVILVVPAPHFTLDAKESLHPQLGPAFRATWTGRLRIIRGGPYLIRGKARIVVDGKEIQGKPVELEPGEHPLRIEAERTAGKPARLQLVWQSDFFKPEPIPGSAFVHRELPAGAEAFASIERGRERALELGCTSCHRAETDGLRGRKGPDLTHLGSRTNARWIARWLEHPQAFRKEAVMPVLLGEGERRDVTAYLAGRTDPDAGAPKAAPDPFRARRGKELFGKVGCAQCHGENGVSLDGMGSKTDAAALAKYLQDPLKVDPHGRMPFLFLHEEDAAALAEHLVRSRNPEFEKDVAGGDAARGKALVRARGCLACHTLDDGGPLANELRAPALKELSPEKGCLAERPTAPAARYDLDDAARKDLRAFLQSFVAVPDRSPAPVHEFTRTVRSLRCTACHTLDGAAPRGLTILPPPLTGAGNKMRASWLDAVLTGKKRARPWMDLRMPHFGEENVRHLVRGFAAAAGAPHGEGDPTPKATKEQVAAGIKLIGREKGGLSCITCHDFKGRISLGTRGPDMVEMYARMRPDWFKRWLRDPIRIQPGTAMPSFFTTVPDAEAERKMEQMWLCLSAGKDMPMAVGFADARTYLLAVRNEPVTLRTFMPDSSPRSIAVGLPGGTSYCFDAQLCRLRYAWEGDFLDMAPVWAGRGGGRARILGERYYTAPDAFPLRIGDPAKEPVRKFRGYRRVKGFPEFMYTVDGVAVRHRITAPEEVLGIVHAFTLGPVEKPIWFLSGRRKGVKVTSSSGEIEDGRIKIPGGKSVTFSVTLEVEE